MRCTVRGLMALTWPPLTRRSASSEALHSVTPASPVRSGLVQAVAITAHRSSAVIRRGRPERGASSSAVMPRAATRPAHLRTVLGQHASVLAMARADCPLATCIVIRARSAARCEVVGRRALRSSAWRSAAEMTSGVQRMERCSCEYGSWRYRTDVPWAGGPL